GARRLQPGVPPWSEEGTSVCPARRPAMGAPRWSDALGRLVAAAVPRWSARAIGGHASEREKLHVKSGPRSLPKGLLPGIPPGSGPSGGWMTRDAFVASSVISPFGSALRNHRGFRPFSIAES